jgi:hypothetical protein
VDSHHPSKPTTTRHWFRRKFYLLLLALLITLGLGLGLGPGLKQGNITPPSPIPTPTSSSPPSQGNLTIRQPIIGSTWEIILSSAFPAPLLTSLNLTYANTSIFDINLFTHPSSTISALHSAGKKVICYFSAGSYKPARPDSAHFARSDQGAQLDRWAGEFWLNTSSPGVRAIMLARLDLARSNGCDGVDPDNVDGYANAHGLGLSITTALSYLSFLADAAHARGLSIGLKDAGAVVGQVVDVMQWEVNKQ